MGNVLGSEKPRSNKHASTNSVPQTPPRTPTLTAASSQTLVSEIRSIYYGLVELPSLAPGDKVNALLTRLVSLCVEPYSQDFITYFFNIEGIHTLCKQLRPLCATAEGELESFWARRIVSESMELKGTLRALYTNSAFLQKCPTNAFQQPQPRLRRSSVPSLTTRTTSTSPASSAPLSLLFYPPQLHRRTSLS